MLACREWVGPLRVAGRAEAYPVLHALKDMLMPLLEPFPSARFRARAYFTRAELEHDLLDPDAVVGAAGELPVLWLNVTYEHPALPADALAPAEQRFALAPLGAYVDQDPGMTPG